MTHTHGRKSSNLSLRYFAKQFMPPIALSAFKKLSPKNTKNQDSITFEVGFQSWADAKSHSTGYDAPDIIRKVRDSAKLVFEGRAEYERDSVIFDKIEYSWPLLASLLFAAASNQKLRVIDFGGALGTTFQQNRKFLTNLPTHCEWRIVEQDALVEIGRAEFTNHHISFYNTIGAATKDGVDVVLFGGSINYVEKPYCFISQAMKSGTAYIIFDRTSITDGKIDSFAVQNVPSSIYKASYPLHKFSYSNLLKSLQQNYDLVEEWICDLQPDPHTVDMGFLFSRKSN
jgi:putative methyltransferase (TIGR04325 family)